MKKEFAPHEESLELKELGFNEICFCYYLYHKKEIRSKELQKIYSPGLVDMAVTPVSTGNFYAFKAPLYQQAFKWFREKHNIDGFIQIEPLNKKYGYVTYDREKGNYIESERKYKVEEAELECLKKLIEIVKEKK